MTIMTRPALTLMLLFSAVPAFAAPPRLERVFPAGLQAGTEAVLDAEGSFDQWPAEVWSTSPGLQISAAPQKGKLHVRAASSVAAGLHWFRLHDPQGASQRCPLVVGSVPELMEIEPNETLDPAQALQGPVVVNGRLDKRGDVDTFRVELRPGQKLVASLDANFLLGSPMDGVLQICSPDGFVIEQNDDTRGIDPLLVLTAPTHGVYYLRVFAFPATPTSAISFANGEDFVYRLTITTAGYLDFGLPLAVRRGEPTTLELFGWNIPEHLATLGLAAKLGEVQVSVAQPGLASFLSLPVIDHANLVADRSSDPGSPQQIPLPATVSGCIEKPRDEDAFEFQASAGLKVTARVESDTLGMLLDPHLVLVNAETGERIAAVDDTNRRRDCVLQATVPVDGRYRLQIRDCFHHGGPRYAYRITLAETQPDFRLTASDEVFVVEQGETLEIPLGVERLDGFDGEIEVLARGLPSNLQVDDVVSAGRGDSAKSVNLKITAAGGPFSGPFRVVGRSKGRRTVEREATCSARGPVTASPDLWLTVR